MNLGCSFLLSPVKHQLIYLILCSFNSNPLFVQQNLPLMQLPSLSLITTTRQNAQSVPYYKSG